MSRARRIYEQRIYEGEWLFVCGEKCEGFLVEYAFNDYESTASEFLSSLTGCHEWERCSLCGGLLQWAGYAGDMPVTDKFLVLVRDGSLMAATVMLAAVTESFICNLVFAAFTDRGVPREYANKLASRRMSRYALDTCRCLLEWPIRDIAFPVRNLVAHGKGFGRDEADYKDELEAQIRQIRGWVRAIIESAGHPKRFMPTETERWILFMDHWSAWLENHVGELLNKRAPEQMEGSV
jgi:hypothetical protein